MTNDGLLRNLRLSWILRWLTTPNEDVPELTKFGLLGVNLGHLLIFVTLSYKLTTGYTGLLTLSTLLLLERTELQRIERLHMFLQLRRTIGETGEKQECDGTGVAQRKDLREKKVT